MKGKGNPLVLLKITHRGPERQHISRISIQDTRVQIPAPECPPPNTTRSDPWALNWEEALGTASYVPQGGSWEVPTLKQRVTNSRQVLCVCTLQAELSVLLVGTRTQVHKTGRTGVPRRAAAACCAEMPAYQVDKTMMTLAMPGHRLVGGIDPTTNTIFHLGHNRVDE